MTMTLREPESTVRTEVLGEELRRLRTAAELTLTDVAARVGIDQSHISRCENGKRPASPEDVAALLVVYGVAGEERRDLLALAKKVGHPGMWQRHGTYEARFAALKLLESRANTLIDFEPLLMPGLLQTVPYTEAVFREVGLFTDEEEIGVRVASRVHRQAVLRKHRAPGLVAILTESVLRNQVGGREVMRDQLRYLVEVAGRPNVILRVVPTAAGGHAGLDGPFLRMKFDDRASVVFLPSRTSSLFLEERSEVTVYDRVVVELLSMAMSEENSVRLVAEMAATLE